MVVVVVVIVVVVVCVVCGCACVRACVCVCVCVCAFADRFFPLLIGSWATGSLTSLPCLVLLALCRFHSRDSYR